MGRTRSKDYASAPLVDGWKKGISHENLATCLAAWMRDMKTWGQDVRDDIIRLEAAVGVARGDPGDPPPAPRK